MNEKAAHGKILLARKDEFCCRQLCLTGGIKGVEKPFDPETENILHD
jgi:hypothetical protein